MTIKIGPKGSFDKQGSITPSTRDLQQFISPNPKAKSLVYLLKDNSGDELNTAPLEQFEKDEISALFVDTSEIGNITQDDYLKKSTEALSCPLYRWQSVTEQDDLFDSRVLGFDGQVTPVGHLENKDFFALYKLAQGFHFRLIPLIKENKDWNALTATMPSFIAIDDNAEIEIPALFKNARCFFMGPESMSESHSLKCLIKKI